MIINLTIIAFVLINIAIFFSVKNRASIIINLLISKLILILFFSQILLNHLLFKEVIMALVIFTIVILVLITNKMSNDQKILIEPIDEEDDNIDEKNKIINNKLITFFCYGFIFAILFFIVIKQDFIYREFKIIQDQHHQESVVEKFNNQLENQQFIEQDYHPPKLDAKAIKQAKMKDQLADNLLLKKSTYAIFAICGLITLVSMFVNNQNQKDV